MHDALASWRKEVANTIERAELVAITAATGVAREIAQIARDDADVTRRSNERTDNEKLQETLASVQPTAERAAREALESARAVMEEASRDVLESAKAAIAEASHQVLESARADLQESVRIAAEAAARPAAETAARAVAEQLLQVSLNAAREDEAASRRQLEERAIVVAERVGRELVKLAFDAATAKGQPAAGESEVSEGKTSDQTAMRVTATPERPVRTAWAATPVLLPWLAAVTLGVLYLLTRNYF